MYLLRRLPLLRLLPIILPILWLILLPLLLSGLHSTEASRDRVGLGKEKEENMKALLPIPKPVFVDSSGVPDNKPLG